MDLQELEKKIIALETDSTLVNALTLLGTVPVLIQDIAVVKAQLNKLE